MKTPIARRVPAACLFAAALSGLVAAQEPGVEPNIELPGFSPQENMQQEMIRLFHEVERTLDAIDLQLADGGAGRIPPPEGKDSGIERLLRSTGQRSDEAVTGMDQILELAARMGGSSGGT